MIQPISTLLFSFNYGGDLKRLGEAMDRVFFTLASAMVTPLIMLAGLLTAAVFVVVIRFTLWLFK